MRAVCTKPTLTVPLKDLVYIKGQKEKVGSIGPHQIGPPDLPEHRRQLGTLKREELRK